MTAFRIIAGLGFLIIGVLVVVKFQGSLTSWSHIVMLLKQQWTYCREAARSPLKSLERLLLIALVVLFGILAFSGFLLPVLVGEHLTGTFLIIHVTVAPLFALSLASLAILWGHRLRLDSLPLNGKPAGLPPSSVLNNVKSWLWMKMSFWSILLLSLPLLLSVILGMYPLFGTDGEQFLIGLHGYSALVLSWIVLLQLVVVVYRPEGKDEKRNEEVNS